MDLEARLVERWRPDDERPEILNAAAHWHPDAAQAPLVIDLLEFFARVLGAE